MILSDYVQTIILAVIQGIAEFLPISSSGHLVVAGALMGEGASSLETNILLHFGTLISILVFFRQKIIDIFRSSPRVLLLLIVGSIPAAVVGLGLKSTIRPLLESPLLSGCMFPITGMMLVGLSRMRMSTEGYETMPIWKAFVIGLAQAVAILPGISRSGSTIVAGAMLGLKRDAAATFSFLLAIPVIGGGALLDFLDDGISMPVGQAATGLIVAFLVGLLALTILIRMLDQGKLHWFAFWLIPFGIIVVIWQLLAPNWVMEQTVWAGLLKPWQ